MPRELKTKEKQAGRRGNNEGSIYQRKDGRWCAQVTIGYKKDGSILKKYVYGKSRQEIARELTKYTQQVYENGYISCSSNDKKWFKIIFEEWFITFKAPNISSPTEEKLRTLMKLHVFKVFGEIEIEQIDLMKLQRFFNNESKQLCLQTIKHMKQLLNQFFEYAVKNMIVKTNPISEIKIRDLERRDEKDERMALTPDQREEIFTALDSNMIITPIVLTFAFTGLRPGELIALKWENINFKESTISVKRAVKREISFDDDGNVTGRTLVLSNTKTAGSVRSFIMPDIVVDCLREWHERQVKTEAEQGIPLTSKNQFVFCTENGTMRSYSGLRSLLKRFLKRIGLEREGISLYTFRHTFATMLLEERENPKIVADLMGHKKVTTTLSVYSHVISRDVYEDTAKTLDGVYSKIFTKKNNPINA